VKYLALPGERPVLGLERAIGRPEVFLIEGVFDWLTAVSWHLPAFSTCGTDFPIERLHWLANAEVIFGVLDGDDAGRAAAQRFGDAFGDRWRAVALPEGLDLNALAQQPDGRETFFARVDTARAATIEPGAAAHR
jgi:DNA primase